MTFLSIDQKDVETWFDEDKDVHTYKDKDKDIGSDLVT